MNTLLAITIFFSGPIGSTFEACYRSDGKPQVCASPNAEAGSSDGRLLYLSHKFMGMAPGTSYQFTYKVNGVESYPMQYTTDILEGPPEPEPECLECPPAEVCPVVTCPVPSPCPECAPWELTYHPNGQPYRDHWMACNLSNFQLWDALVKCRATTKENK